MRTRSKPATMAVAAAVLIGGGSISAASAEDGPTVQTTE